MQKPLRGTYSLWHFIFLYPEGESTRDTSRMFSRNLQPDFDKEGLRVAECLLRLGLVLDDERQGCKV